MELHFATRNLRCLKEAAVAFFAPNHEVKGSSLGRAESFFFLGDSSVSCTISNRAKLVPAVVRKTNTSSQATITDPKKICSCCLWSCARSELGGPFFRKFRREILSGAASSRHQTRLSEVPSRFCNRPVKGAVRLHTNF